MPERDVVRVIVDGKELRGWEAVTISMAVDQIADAISLDGPWDWTRKELREIFRPDAMPLTQVYIDEDLVFTGRLERMQPKRSASDRLINVSGRSLPGVLIDCSHRGQLEYYDLALSTICKQVCAPFCAEGRHEDGHKPLQVRADNDTNPIPVARATYGQTAADFLVSLAAPRNILLNSSYKGELVLTWGRRFVGTAPVARLVEGEHPVLDVAADYDMTKRYSVYQVATQFAGLPDIIDIAYDRGVPIYRPSCRPVADATTSPEDEEALAALEVRGPETATRSAARWRAIGLTSFASFSLTLSGWRRPDGKRWAERQVVSALAPSAMVYKETAQLIAGCTLRLSVNEGRTTALRLVMPETYAGKIPEGLSWE